MRDAELGREIIGDHFRRSLEVLGTVTRDAAFLASVDGIARAVGDVLRGGRKLLLAGNGGSAADAQHIAAEFVGRFRFDRPSLPALALTTDTSVLTAIGNDLGFEQVFARQVTGLGQAGDALIAISTSGRSPNVLAALSAAREKGLLTIGFTGASGRSMLDLCDLALVVPCADTAVIQQIHMVAAHAICGCVEQELFPRQGSG